ncbi:MAG: hypothetical protein SFT92_00995 [Rickettsiales bacterium]|nr:hypothetical protein [Rickettsiales bacterium]
MSADMQQSGTTPNDDDAAVSRREKIFNWLTYGGIAGLGTFLVTIPTTYWAKYGGGANLFKAAAKELERTGFHPETAEQIVTTTALMQGGNITLFPVKFMEDHKAEIIGKDPAKEQNKQDWTSLIKARLVAWGAVFASFKGVAKLIGGDKLTAFEEKFAKHVVCDPLGKATHIAGAETKLYRYGKIAALDVFATVAASTLLYMGSRLFAKPAVVTLPAGAEPTIDQDIPSTPMVEAKSFVNQLSAHKDARSASFVDGLAAQKAGHDTNSVSVPS